MKNTRHCEREIFPVSGLSSESNRWRIRRASEKLVCRQKQFEDLICPLTRSVHAAALYRYGNRTLADDLVQDTFLYAWKNFDSFRLGTNFKAWIFKILFNLGANELRKVKHREKMASRLAEEALRSGKNVAGNDRRNAAVDWERQYPELVDDGEKMALDNLNENQRKVFMRVLLGGLSYRECAHEMNIPLGTVMSRLFRARNQLSAELPLPPLTNVRRPAKTVKCGEIARTATSMR